MPVRVLGRGGWLAALCLALTLVACGREDSAGGAESGPSASGAWPDRSAFADNPSSQEGLGGFADIPADQEGIGNSAELPDGREEQVGEAPREEEGTGRIEADGRVTPQPPSVAKQRNLPEGFVYLDETIPDALFDIRYASDYNFVGAVIDGYNAPLAILSEPASEALKAVNEELKESGRVLLVYDAYRPVKAVDHFKRWAQDSEAIAMKDVFYPNVDKSQVFKLGYVASKSGHSRGSTVDLTLADMVTGVPEDMGSPYDFFGDISSHGTKEITAEQTANRELLKKTMVKHGFRPYNKEWWHYTLNDEPYPKKYFDFDVE